MAQEHEASHRDGLAAAAQARAAAWLDVLREHRAAAGGARPSEVLGGLSRDPEGFEFLRRLLELVGGTDDAIAQSLGLRDAAQDLPPAMPAKDRLAVRAGGMLSLGLPWAVMPVARRWLRERVSHLVLATKLPSDGAAEPGRLPGLTEALRRRREAGFVPVVAPLGDGVHGPAGAAAELARLRALAAHPAVSHLAVDPARLAPGGGDWSAEADTAAAAQALGRLFAEALQHDTLVVVEPRSVRWARLLPEVLVRALADASLDRARVGVRLLAELPESLTDYERLRRWAQRRVADGGAPAEVVIGVGGVSGEERIASLRSGLAVPVVEGRVQIGAQLLRLAEWALHPGRAAVLRPVFESEDPHLLAAVVELAERLGSGELFSVQLRAGTATGLAEIVRESAPETRLHLPVVAPREFGGAIGAVVGFAAEAADPGSAMARLEAMLTPASPGVGEAGDEADAVLLGAEDALAAETQILHEALALAADDPPAPHRTQLRAREWDPSERDSALFYRPPDEPSRFDTGGLTAAVLGLSRGSTGEIRLESIAPARPIPVVHGSGFACEPDTDASVAANREWARTLLRSAAERTADRDRLDETIALSPAELDPEAAAEAAREAGAQWSEQGHQQRARRLRRAALATVAARDRLLQSLAVDTGAPVAELDAEINDIVDAARYCGQLAEGLAAVRGARFEPERLALVVGCDGTPLSVQAEAVLAALAAGSAVLWAAPQRLLSSAEVLAEEWEAGGVPPGTVRVEGVVRGDSIPEIAARQSIDRALVLGERSTALALVKARPELRVEGWFQECGAILVTPSADIDAAVRDIVRSAFRGAGADPRTAHAVVLASSAARSKRFRETLADAVRALRVGDAAHPGDLDPLSFDLGPLPAPPGESGLRALTELGKGETWLVEPERLDPDGRLWRPGVRLGVAAGSPFWEDARGMPVIGIAHAHTFASGVALQNRIGGGAVAGLQSSDPDETLHWLEHAQAAALSINRPTSDARIERQPSGGWDDAVMGIPALAGGPCRLLALGSWSPRPGTRSETLHLRGLDPEVQVLIETAQASLSYEEFDGVRRAALADAIAWRTSLGIVRDTIGLGIERNVLRYEPVATQIRLAEGASLAALLRVLAAALLARVPVSVSTGEVLPPEVTELLERQGIEVSLEHDDDWMSRLAVSGPLIAEGVPAARVRLIGGDRVRAAEWMGGLDRAALWAEPVTMAGPVELLTLLREQSVSARAHRHGLAVAVPGLDEIVEG